MTIIWVRRGIPYKIGWEAFRDCLSLAKIKLPDAVTMIESETFGDCLSLKDVWIGKNVTGIEGDAFRGCDALETIFFGGTDDDWLAIEEHGYKPRGLHVQCENGRCLYR